MAAMEGCNVQPLPWTLEGLLEEGQRLHLKVDDADFKDDRERKETTSRAEVVLTALQERLASEGVFSKNEEIDDISTDMLPMLATDFYLGSLLLKLQFRDPRSRHAVLRRAETLLSNYLDLCERLRIMARPDCLAWRAVTTSAADESGVAAGVGRTVTREQKIERFRRQKKARERIKEIEGELKLLEAKGDCTEWQGNGKDEDVRRERSMLLLGSFASDALDELSGLTKEVVMVQHLLEAEDRGEDSFSVMKDARNIQNDMTEDRMGGQGLQVTHISSSQGRLQMRKEEVRAGVFRPTVELPTMTVEEYGELELERARQREKKELERTKSTPMRRYDQLEGDGDEDNEDLVEEAVYRDRKWDDWKDANPRGAGNKANKII